MVNNALDIIGTSVGGVQPNLSIDNVSVVEDLSGDFQFSRGSAATRVNAQGLVENVQIISEELVSNGDFSQIGSEEVLNGNFSQIGSEEVLNGNFSQEGSELVTNGSFDTDSNWTLSSGITYNANGYIDFDGTQGGGQARNTPNITFVQGKTYKVVYEIKNYVSGAIKFRFQTGWNTIGQQQSGNGLKTEYIVCNDSSNNNFQFFNSPSFIGSIDNVSVKEVGQNWDLGSGWSIGDGKASCDGSGNSPLTQSNILTVGKTYKIEYTISDYVSGNFKMLNIPTSSYENSNGTYTIYGKTDSVNLVPFGASFIGSITNISVKEVGQNWVFSSGASLTSLGANITHAPTAGSIAQPSVLVVGNQYKLTYEITENITGGLKINSAVDASMITTVGVHTKYFEADLDTLSISRTNASNNNVTITNISVKEVGQDWTLGTGWSIGDGKVYFDNPTGTELYQSLSTTASKYRISFDLDITSGTIQTSFNSPSTSTIESFTTSGIKTVDITTTASFSRFRFVGVGGSVFNIDNISVKEITDDTDIPRINYSGFSYQDSLGSELVVNGDFATDSNWTKGSGWSIANGKASCDGTNITYLTQTSVLNTGKSYKVQFDIVDYTSGSVKYRDNGLVSGQSFSGVGSYTDYVIAGGGQFRLMSENFIGSIDNVSVKEVLGQEVVPDSGCGSWLLEPQSTNLVAYSEDFSNVYWDKSNTTVLQNQSIAPSGLNEASLVSAVGSNPRLKFNGNFGGGDFSLSWFAKKNTSSYLKIRVWNGSVNHDAVFDLDNGTLTSGNGSIKSYGNGWYRCTLNYDTAGSHFTQTYVSDTSTGSLYLWGAQLEEQSYATSYIPTNGATSTRLQDLANNSGNATLINSTEGVLYAEIAALAENEGNRCITISANSSNKVMLRFTTLNRVQVFVVSNGVLVSNELHTLTNITDFNKFAFKYKSGDNRLFVNGLKVDDNNDTFSFTSDLNKVNFNEDGGQNFYGKNKALAVYKEALTDTNLRCLTYPNPVATTFDLNFSTIADDFTFTRGSEATFVNEQGLIQSTNTLTSNLVIDEESLPLTGWSRNGDVYTAVNASSNVVLNLTSGFNFSIGDLVEVSYEVFDYVSGQPRIQLSGGGQAKYTTPASSNGVFTEILTLTGSNTAGAIISNNSNPTLKIRNLSIKKIITATNTPRIDYSTGEAAFLLEPQSTNLITYSEDFSNSSWVKSGSSVEHFKFNNLS